MSDQITTPVAFSGSIPGNYDQYLGPMFFEPFAEEVSDRIVAANPLKLLELASGTGRLTRHLAAKLPARANIYASDINPAMISHGKDLISSNKLHWMEIDAVNLPFPDQIFDCVAVQFGVMFYSNKLEAFSEARRVLKKGGQMIFTCWDHISQNPVAELTNRALSKFFPHNTPAFYQVPFSYHDTTRIEKDLKMAGFSNLRIETLSLSGVSFSPREAVLGLVSGTPTITAIEEISPAATEKFMEYLEKELAGRFGTKQFHVPLQAHVVTCS